MNAEQLLKQVYINRELILRRSEEARGHLEMLKKDFAHLLNDDVAINIEFNQSLLELYLNCNYITAIDNSMAALDRFANSTNKYAITLHLKMVGHCYAHTGEHDLAERYLLEALETLPTEAENAATKADILQELAMTAEYKDDKSPKIKDYLLDAIELLWEQKYIVKKANCLMGMGNYLNNIDEVHLALEHYHRAAETFEKSYLLVNMANCYSNMGSCYIKLRDFNVAEKHLNKALELRLKTGSLEQLSISYFNLGVLYMERGDFELAEEMLIKALNMVEELGNKHFVDRINVVLHQLGLKKNNTAAA